MLTITIRELREHNACDLDERVTAWERHYGHPLADDEPLPLAELAGIPWRMVPECSTRDLMWALRCCWDRGGREVGVEVACRAAERALPRAREVDLPVLRAAISAARAAVAPGAGEVERQDAAAAAAAAYATTAAAYAAIAAAAAYATAAAYAASAADASASASASASYAAAYAADWQQTRADLMALISEDWRTR